MIATLEPFLPFMRGLLSLVIAFSAVSLLHTARVLHADFRPHAYFVAFWSGVNAVLMALLATGSLSTLVGTGSILSVLNISSIMLIGGWSTLFMRVAVRIKAAAKHIQMEE